MAADGELGEAQLPVSCCQLHFVSLEMCAHCCTHALMAASVSTDGSLKCRTWHADAGFDCADAAPWPAIDRVRGSPPQAHQPKPTVSLQPHVRAAVDRLAPERLHSIW